MTPASIEASEFAFAITVDFVKGKGDPSRPFRTMIDLMEALARFDRDFWKQIWSFPIECRLGTPSGAFGLFQKGQKNIRAALERIIEKAAIQAYAKIIPLVNGSTARRPSL